MHHLQNIIENMSEEMYLRLKSAAETGKWPEGIVVEQAQRDNALQLIMAYQAKYLNSNDILTIGADGEIVTKTKSELRNQFKQQTSELPQTLSPDPSHNNTIARFSEL